jgi:hypothetical protein
VRLFLLQLALAGAAAGASPVEPCSKLEIAFVHSFLGTWRDEAYNNRQLVKNLPVCSDSKLVRVKEGSYSANDRLQLTDLMGEPIRPPFVCSERLNCKDAIQPSDIREKLEARLKGMSPGESLSFFQRTRTAQTSTISRIRSASQAKSADGVKMNNAVVTAGQPLKASAVLAATQPGQTYTFDLCLNAENHSCGASMPKSIPYRSGEPDLPFGKLPPGLHVLFEVKTLPDDTVPLRTGNRVFILAAHPSWTAQALSFVRTKLALALANPDAPANELDGDLLALGVELSRPAVVKP